MVMVTLGLSVPCSVKKYSWLRILSVEICLMFILVCRNQTSQGRYFS